MNTFKEMVEFFKVEELEFVSGSFIVAFENGQVNYGFEDVTDLLPIVIDKGTFEFRCTHDFSITTMFFIKNNVHKNSWANSFTSFERFE